MNRDNNITHPCLTPDPKIMSYDIRLQSLVVEKTLLYTCNIHIDYL